MKAFLCTFFLLFYFATYGIAQKRFTPGLTLGLSTSQVSGDNLGGFRQFGFVGGGSISTAFSDRMGARMEIMYIDKGSRKAPRADEGNVFYNLRLQYIEVPIMFGYQLGKYTYEAGPSFGALIDVQEENHFGELTYPDRPFKSFEANLNVAISRPLGEHFHFSWRFIQGVTPIRRHAANVTFRLNRGQYNSVLAFLLRYEF